MSSKSAGYSGTPLWKKLGIKSGQRIHFYKPPANLEALLEGAPLDTSILKSVRKPVDYIHIFAASTTELKRAIGKFREKIVDDGMIWVSWYKKASKIPTDITEDVVRSVCLPTGLVDVKVCAVDDKWSGLKLVIQKELRGK